MSAKHLARDMSREVYMCRYMSLFIENEIAGFKKNRDPKTALNLACK